MPLPHRLQEAAHELHRRPAGGNEAEDKLGQFVSRLITMTTLQTPVTLKCAAFRWEREERLLQQRRVLLRDPSFLLQRDPSFLLQQVFLRKEGCGARILS